MKFPFQDASRVSLAPIAGGHAPIVIGAIGGSGTRIVAEILSEAGVHMGTAVSPKTWDSLPMRALLEDGFRPLVRASWEHATSLPAPIHGRLVRAIETHRGAGAATRWGWKNPRNAWFLPVLAQLLPAMKFVHLVRDGRDVALSGNRFLLKTQGEFLLAREGGVAAFDSAEAAQLALWTQGTRWALECCERYLPERALTVRYEDLCADPRSTIARILELAGVAVAPEALDRLAAKVSASPGIGRGVGSTLAARVPHADEMLAAFGYTLS